MKNSTLFRRSAFLALGGVMLASASASAADIFTRTSFTPTYGQHRGIPIVGDYNNDGIMDFYLGGQNWNAPLSWHSLGSLYTGKGDGTFDFSYSAMFDNNTVLVDANDESKGYLKGKDDNGNYLAHGLPPTTFSSGYFFDYDNDGNLDFLVTGASDYDIQVNTDFGGFYTWLYRNTGAPDYNFVATDTQTFPQADNEKNKNNDGVMSWNPHGWSFADYDHDGYIDVLCQVMDHWLDGEDAKSARAVKLFHNNGDGTFTEKKVFTPIAHDSNPLPSGLFEIDEETFDYTPTMAAKPMSGVAAQFGDLDNDGYVDIVCAGYTDDGAGQIYIYKNNGDGTFTEQEHSSTLKGIFNGDLMLADLNNDGLLDIITAATTGDWTGEIQGYYNAGNFTFTIGINEHGNTGSLGLIGCRDGQIRVIDLNHDGLVDIVVDGWSGSEASNYAHIFTQNAGGTFTFENSNASTSDDWSVNPWGNGCGTFEFIDLNNDGVPDYMQSGVICIHNSNDGRFFGPVLYSSNYTEATTPTAPTNLDVTENSDGTITITWETADDDGYQTTDLSYNIYVKNNATGKIFQMIPANIETGRLKVYHDLQTAVHGDGVSYEYTMKALGNGNCTVGVQAINPSWIGGPFATKDITVTTNVNTVSKAKASVSVRGNGIYATAQAGTLVTVYNTVGTLVAQGQANALIPVAGNGVFVVKVGNESYKVTK